MVVQLKRKPEQYTVIVFITRHADCHITHSIIMLGGLFEQIRKRRLSNGSFDFIN